MSVRSEREGDNQGILRRQQQSQPLRLIGRFTGKTRCSPCGRVVTNVLVDSAGQTLFPEKIAVFPLRNLKWTYWIVFNFAAFQTFFQRCPHGVDQRWATQCDHHGRASPTSVHALKPVRRARSLIQNCGKPAIRAATVRERLTPSVDRSPVIPNRSLTVAALISTLEPRRAGVVWD